MAYRDHWSAEGLSEITNTTTTYSDLVSLTHTAANQVASADYVLFWSAQGKINITSVDYNLRLLKDGSQLVLCNNEQQEIATPEDYDAQGGMVFYTAASTPVDVAFKIQLAVETATNTGKAKNGRLNILKLGANDKFATSTTRVTTTSGTFQDSACSITFTPPSSGDYILIATANLDVNPTTGDARMRISDGTNLSFESGIRGIKDTTSRTAGMIIWRQNAVSGSKTYKVQYASVNGGGETIGISEMRLLVLRVSDFDAVRYAGQGADSAGPETTYTTVVSDTFTPSGNDHLTLAGWRFGGDLNTISSYTQFLDDATVVAESIREPAASSGRWTALTNRIATYAASSRTLAIQRKTENASSEAFTADVDAILSLDLGPASTGITGTVAVTDAADTSDATGGVKVSGSSSVTDAADASAAVGGVKIAGTAAATDADDTSSATGAVGSGGISGSVAVTDAADTSAAAGAVRISGSAAQTDAADTSAASGTVGLVPITGTVAVTDANDTSTAAGAARVSGSVAANDNADTSSATGAVRISGTVAVTDANDTSDARQPALPITGAVTANDADDVSEAVGTVALAGGTYPQSIAGGGAVILRRLSGGGSVVAASIQSTGRVIAGALKERP